MKLLVYSHFFAPSIGGVESAVLSLAGGLYNLRTTKGDSEFDVTLVTHTPAGDFDDRSLPFRVVRQPSLFHLWRIVRQCEVMHIAGPALPPLFLGWLARKPTVVEHHGYQAICPNGLMVHQPDRSICPGHFQGGHYLKCVRCREYETSLLHSIKELLFMFPRLWLCRTISRNLAISRHVLERHGLPNTSVVYYGIEDPLGKGPIAPPPAHASGKMSFAYVGRFFPEKGIATLLEAARILKAEGWEFDVRLIGDGPQRKKLEEIIEANNLGSRVQITGYLTGPTLADALREVRVVIMPSVCEETAGLAAIEQMIRGRLVIASRIGGLAEVVSDCGLQFPSGNAKALADCMRKVIQNDSIIDSIGPKARERALELFLRARMVEQHAVAYREIVRSGSATMELS
jgi:glycogen(starch) synthase